MTRPLRLPDTASMAGYDHLDAITQFFLGGPGAAADATGVSDDARYAIDTNNAGTGGKAARFLPVAPGDFAATVGTGLFIAATNNYQVGTTIIITAAAFFVA